MSSPAPSRRDVGAIVVAAGRGSRLGGEPKQFRPVAGVPLLLRALRPFLAHPEVGPVVAVLPAEAVAAPPDWLAGLVGERLTLITGGFERADSVRAGLAALPAECDTILIHDGARPFVSSAVIDQIIAEARGGRGAVAAIPVQDSVKRGEASPGGGIRIRGTVPRHDLWRAQTPQGFPRQMLLRAHAGGESALDDAELVERLGETVILVPDSPHNLKVTTADDLLLAEALAGLFRP